MQIVDLTIKILKNMIQMNMIQIKKIDFVSKLNIAKIKWNFNVEKKYF